MNAFMDEIVSFVSLGEFLRYVDGAIIGIIKADCVFCPGQPFDFCLWDDLDPYLSSQDCQMHFNPLKCRSLLRPCVRAPAPTI